ncbi:MAG: type VI secretion system baseplate subunit TssE [Planctomycetes bacterium]|nr:type VI secretion system baseplate subunit TssE [Planctomycetota bacterium]
MARSDSKKPVMPSLLDRLIDDAPESNVERFSEGYQNLAEMQAAIRRDIENLLNTRKRQLDWPAVGELVERSVLGYGVPDISGRQLGSAQQRAQFLKSVEDLIRRYEPRFKRVKVSPQSAVNPLDRTLHFSIDADVFAEPAPEHVAFDTTVEPVTRSLKVDLSDSR